jgi:hypothetical protein
MWLTFMHVNGHVEMGMLKVGPAWKVWRQVMGACLLPALITMVQQSAEQTALDGPSQQ